MHTLQLTSHRRFTAPIEYTVTTYRQEQRSHDARTLAASPPPTLLLSPLRGHNSSRYGANPPRGRIADAADAADVALAAVTAPPPFVQEGSSTSEWLPYKASEAVQPPTRAESKSSGGKGLITIPKPLAEAFDHPRVECSDVLPWAPRTGTTLTRLTHDLPLPPPPRRAALRQPARPAEGVLTSPIRPRAVALSRPGLSCDDVANAAKTDGLLTSRQTPATPAQQAAAKTMSAAVAAAAKATSNSHRTCGSVATCCGRRRSDAPGGKRKPTRHADWTDPKKVCAVSGPQPEGGTWTQAAAE